MGYRGTVGLVAVACAWLATLPAVVSAQVEAEFSDEFSEEFDEQLGDEKAPSHDDDGADEEADADAEEPDAAPSDEQREADLLRVQNTWLGPSGGLHVPDAGSSLPGTFRLQLGVDFFSSSDYLIQGDENDYVGGTLSLSWTVADFLEVYGSLSNHANSNTEEDPVLLQVLGDTMLGLKAFYAASPWLTVGGDVRFVVLNSVGDIGPVLESTSFGFRANLSGDFRQLESPFPLIGRLSFDYFFDNSAHLIEDVENARFERIGADRRSRANEDRHLVRRVERFALGINRLDMFTIGLGFELPLHVDEDVYIHPLLEWTVGLPVNRQDYSCLLVATDGSPSAPDSCLDIEGFAAMPSTLSLGARFYPGVRGLTIGLGIDIGLSGTSTFVRELAANKPHDFLFTLSYAVDAREPKVIAEVTPVEVVREVVKEPPPKPRVQGVVVDAQSGQPVGGATIRYPDLGLTAQQADEAGQFISYPLDAGEVRFEVSHPDYEPRVCIAAVPEAVAPVPEGAAPAPVAGEPGAPAAPTAAPAAPGDGAPVPALPETPAPAAAATAPAPSTEPTLVPLRCELIAQPKNGSLRGQVIGKGAAGVSGAAVELSGPSSHQLTTDATGLFALPDLPAGSYSVKVDADGYLLKLEQIEIKAQQTAMPTITLVEKPKKSQVELTKQEVRIRKQVFFKTNSAEISERSNELLSEVADVLLRNPHVLNVEVQGHTDNKGDPEYNRNLSQQRAESVMQWLINAGVSASRLSAHGYGDTRPVVPNLTDANRARNRRVQFIIKEQDLSE